MNTLYEQYPHVWKMLSDEGKASLGEMAKHFDAPAAMDAALGYTAGGTVGHWVSGRNGASKKSDRLAAKWLEEKSNRKPAPPSDGVLMVIPPAAKMDAVRRVLAALGCEVIDV